MIQKKAQSNVSSLDSKLSDPVPLPAVVLQSHGLISAGATCYTAKAFRETMQAPSDAKVCVTNNIVTSQGPGTSLLFALTLGEQMVS